MKKYKAKSLEFPKEGFEDLYILSVASLPATIGGAPVNDFAAGFGTKTIVLDANPAAGDIYYEAVVDVKTPLAGMTGAPTVKVNLTTAGDLTGTVVANSAATQGGMTAASGGKLYCQAADSLNLLCAAGGGGGEVPTAGEIWVWVKKSGAGRFTLTQA